jgi:hypothetical protein
MKKNNQLENYTYKDLEKFIIETMKGLSDGTLKPIEAAERSNAAGKMINLHRTKIVSDELSNRTGKLNTFFEQPNQLEDS